MTEPRDPLTHETLSVPESERVHSNVPESYRLGIRGTTQFVSNTGQVTAVLPTHYVLQGAFRTYNEQGMVQYEWRDLPTVEL